MRFAQAILLFTLFSAVSLAQTPQPVSSLPSKVDDVYLAKDNGEGKAGAVADVFGTADIPIHCVVMLTGMESAAVRMMLVAVKVPGVKAESKVVSAAYTTKHGQDRVFFTGRPDGKWVPGAYRIDVFVDDKKERSVSFEVKGTAAPAAASKFAPTKPPKRRN